MLLMFFFSFIASAQNCIDSAAAPVGDSIFFRGAIDGTYTYSDLLYLSGHSGSMILKYHWIVDSNLVSGVSRTITVKSAADTQTVFPVLDSSIINRLSNGSHTIGVLFDTCLSSLCCPAFINSKLLTIYILDPHNGGGSGTYRGGKLILEVTTAALCYNGPVIDVRDALLDIRLHPGGNWVIKDPDNAFRWLNFPFNVSCKDKFGIATVMYIVNFSDNILIASIVITGAPQPIILPQMLGGEWKKGGATYFSNPPPPNPSLWVCCTIQLWAQVWPKTSVPYSYHWIFPNGFNVTENDPSSGHLMTKFPCQLGNYTVIVTDGNGCISKPEKVKVPDNVAWPNH